MKEIDHIEAMHAVIVKKQFRISELETLMVQYECCRVAAIQALEGMGVIRAYDTKLITVKVDGDKGVVI